MRRNHLKDMPTDELWALHQEVTALLAEKIMLEKGVLEDRLRQLHQPTDLKTGSTLKNAKSSRPRSTKSSSETPARRAYPTVSPKYQNHTEPHETWSGRGKQPRWLTAQLRSGKQIEDFRIDPVRSKVGGSAGDEIEHIELRLASVR